MLLECHAARPLQIRRQILCADLVILSPLLVFATVVDGEFCWHREAPFQESTFVGAVVRRDQTELDRFADRVADLAPGSWLEQFLPILDQVASVLDGRSFLRAIHAVWLPAQAVWPDRTECFSGDPILEAVPHITGTIALKRLQFRASPSLEISDHATHHGLGRSLSDLVTYATESEARIAGVSRASLVLFDDTDARCNELCKLLPILTLVSVSPVVQRVTEDRESSELIGVKRIEIEHDITRRNIAIILGILGKHSISDSPAELVRDASHRDIHSFVWTALDLAVVASAVADSIRGDGLDLWISVLSFGQDLSLISVSIDVDRAQVNHGAKVVDLSSHIACREPLLLQPARRLFAPLAVRTEEDWIPCTSDCVHSLLR